MQLIVYFLAAILVLAAPALADVRLGLNANGKCNMRTNCYQRGEDRNADALMDQIRDGITKRGYRCPEPIPAFHHVESHKGEVYLVQCGSSGLLYRVEIYEDGRHYTVRPTEAASVTDIFLW